MSSRIKNTKAEGMEDFLNKKDPNIEELRKKLMEDSTKPQDDFSKMFTQQGGDKQFENREDLENYLNKQKRLRARVPLKKQLSDFVSSKFKITVGNNSIYVWKSRRFEEMIYMHIPRMLFLTASCYVIYRINLRQ